MLCHKLASCLLRHHAAIMIYSSVSITPDSNSSPNACLACRRGVHGGQGLHQASAGAAGQGVLWQGEDEARQAPHLCHHPAPLPQVHSGPLPVPTPPRCYMGTVLQMLLHGACTAYAALNARPTFRCCIHYVYVAENVVSAVRLCAGPASASVSMQHVFCCTPLLLT